jgi:hypothetical protein
MDSEEVIFVQEKRKYRRKKGCSVMPLPKKAKKPSPKMEAAAKTTRKYTKKALILKKAIKIPRSTLKNLNLFLIFQEVSAVVKPPSKKASSSGPLLLQNYLKEVVPIHTQAAQYTYGGVAPAPTFPPPARVQQGCNHCCVHQQMMHHHHHHPPPPPPSNYYPHPYRSQLYVGDSLLHLNLLNY